MLPACLRYVRKIPELGIRNHACSYQCLYVSGQIKNAAFTLNGFDEQERNLAFEKTGFQV